MTANRQLNLIETRIQNDRQAVACLREEILLDLRRTGFAEPDTFGIMIALTEAMENAYRHGNQQDPNTWITVRYLVSRTLVIIEVEDEGAGFVPDHVPDPTDAARLHLTSGRGIRMMKALVDDVQYRFGGTLVRLTKQVLDARLMREERQSA